MSPADTMVLSTFVHMKIMLVNPPRSMENNILRYAPEDARPFIHKKLIGPPLGLLTIASAVKDHDVTVFDMKGEYDLNPDTPSPDRLMGILLEKHKPDIVGITVITSEFNNSIQIARTIKSIDPSILMVAGGLHATLCPRDFTNSCFDVVIPGQCPHIFRNLVLSKENSRPLEEVAGILINGKAGFERTKGQALIPDFIDKDYLMPDRTHLRRWLETYKVGNSHDPSTYIYTSLGCTHKCTFCSIWTQFKGAYYQRTVESLIHELKSIEEYPVVRFADANTVVDMQFMSLLFDKIQSEGIKKTFIMDIRADVAVKNPWIIEKMTKGGLKVVICGFESFRDEELKKYHKKSLAKFNQEAIKVFEVNGIMVRGNYVVPCDYKLDDFKALSGYAAENPVVYAGYTILSPMPGTVYYRKVRDQIVDHNFDRYNFFNALLRTGLPYEDFHHEVAKLWLIRKGTDVI